MADSSILECGCRLFCPSHGREEIEHMDDGTPYCNECAMDGWDPELCEPSPRSCAMGHYADKSNEWERSFMCEAHAAEHREFCAEVATEGTPNDH